MTTPAKWAETATGTGAVSVTRTGISGKSYILDAVICSIGVAEIADLEINVGTITFNVDIHNFGIVCFPQGIQAPVGASLNANATFTGTGNITLICRLV